MSTEVNCKICGSIATLIKEGLTGYQENKVYDIYNCSTCDTNFSIPGEVDSGIYDAIYRNGLNVPNYAYYHKYSKAVLTQENPLKYLAKEGDAYWAIENSIKLGNIQKTDKILEVGCGLGYLTYSLKRAGFDITGIDISQKAIELAIKTYGNFYRCADINEMAKNDHERYDVIILTEVIEHISNPVIFIESLKKLLTQKGKIILTTPNKSAFPKSSVWECDLPPVHLYWLSEDSFKIIGENLQMNVGFMDFSGYNWLHFDASKIMPSLMRGTTILNSNEQVIEQPKSPIFSFAVNTLNKYRFLKFSISFVLMSPNFFSNNWKRRHFMCVTLSAKQ